MRTEMFTAAEALDFERAARLRDELKRLEVLAGKDGASIDGAFYDPYAGGNGGKRKPVRSRGGLAPAKKAAGTRSRYKR
jgi:excinuclease ABC subunit B